MTTSKWIIERAVFRDDRGDPDRAWMLDLKPLVPNDRLVMCALLSRAAAETAVIDADHTPSLSDLAELTGLDRSTVRRALNRLEAACWVVRNRPDPADARSKGARTWYRLGAPGRDGMPLPVNDEVEADSPPGRGTTPLPKTGKVEAPRPQSGGTTPLPVGAQCTTGRGHVPPIPLSTPDRPTEDQNHQRAGASDTQRETAQKPKTADGMLPLPVPVTTSTRGRRQPDPGPPAALDDARPGRRGMPTATAAGNQLVAEHLAAYPYEPSREVRQWTYTAVEKQLAQGIDPEMVRIGLALLREDQQANPGRDIGPGLLPKYVDQARRGVRPGQRRRGSGFDPNAGIYRRDPNDTETEFTATVLSIDEWMKGA